MDQEYLTGAGELAHRSLAELDCRVLDGEDHGQGVESWNFILDGPRVLVTSSSGMHLRSHNHHLAIGAALETDEDEVDGRVFIPCLRTKTYASQGREGFLETLYRGVSLDAALGAINDAFEDWRLGEHGINAQPADQTAVTRDDFERAFRQHPTRPGESDDRTDALATELYPVGFPLASEPMAARVFPFHRNPYRGP